MAGDVGAMLLSFWGGTSAMGLSYACTMLQLHLGLSFFIGAISLMAAAHHASQPNPKRFEAVPQVVEEVGRHLALLAAFALLQVPDGDWTTTGISFSMILALIINTAGYLVAVFYGQTRQYFEGTIVGKFDKVLHVVVNVWHIVSAIPLLFTVLPGGVQLSIASAVVRLALTAEVIRSLAVLSGLKESVLDEACGDVKDALCLAPLLSGLAISEHAAWGAGTLVSIPFQPSFYFALGLAAQVALVLVLHFACGGGLKTGSAACNRVVFFNLIAKGGVCLGIIGCVVSIFYGLFEFSFSRSGFSIHWGQPTLAATLILALMALLSELAKLFAPALQKATIAQESNGFKHTEACEEEADVAEAPRDEADLPAAAGLAEALTSITSRAPGLTLALAALQMGSSEAYSFPALQPVVDMFNAPFRAGFLLCTIAMMLQVFMVCSFTAYHCDVVPAPETPLDVTGTLRWEPEGVTARKVIGMLRGLVLLLLHLGLLLGTLGLGMLAWVIGPLAISMVLMQEDTPWLGMASAVAYMKSTCGVFGAWSEAYMANKRKIAEEAAARQADEVLATEEQEQKKPRKTTEVSNGGEPKNNWKAAPTKKATGSKKKKN